MSFYEFWGERVDPGKVGKVALSTEHEACTCRPLVLGKLLFVTIVLPVAWALVIPYVPLPAFQAAVLVVGITLIYVAISYFLDPQPDTDNLGWCGGLVDHPWRYSDDLNRWLMTLKIVLAPGRFVAESVLDVIAPPEPGASVEEDTPGEPDQPPDEFQAAYQDWRSQNL